PAHPLWIDLGHVGGPTITVRATDAGLDDAGRIDAANVSRSRIGDEDKESSGLIGPRSDAARFVERCRRGRTAVAARSRNAGAGHGRYGRRLYAEIHAAHPWGEMFRDVEAPERVEDDATGPVEFRESG